MAGKESSADKVGENFAKTEALVFVAAMAVFAFIFMFAARR